MDNLKILIDELRSLPLETPWIEFKHNNYDPEIIGKDISALANSALINDHNHAYMIWGIDDKNQDVVGTDYNLQNLKKGGEELDNWLRGNLSKNADFVYDVCDYENKRIGVLKIAQAFGQAVSFKKENYIRIGSYTKKINEYPVYESKLWDKLNNLKFEDRSAKDNLKIEEALRLLQYSSYFDMTKKPEPTTQEEIAYIFNQEGILRKQDNGLYTITNLGAILFAKSLDDFSSISRKAIRIVKYQDKSRLLILKENTEDKGYAANFENILKLIKAYLPSKETIINGLRTNISSYPDIAIREIIVNALIHQDFSISGTGAVIEIFSNRIEVTNPGTPLIEIYRIVDNPPRSRNEKLAELSRRLRMCEELGSGWDKIIASCELMQLPAPHINIYEESTKVTMLQALKFADMSLEDKLWATYMHACIKYLNQEQLSNASLRERFGLKESSSGSVSRLIKLAVDKNLIKPFNNETAPRYMKYIPIWA